MVTSSVTTSPSAPVWSGHFTSLSGAVKSCAPDTIKTHPLTSAPARSRLNANAVVAGSLAAPMSVEMKKPASLVAAILLWLIAFAQLARVLFRVEVTAGGLNIPLWISILAFIVLAAVGIWLWRERREHG